ncbi:MAG: DUF1232 domain-containing protein [Chloroflexi bacterium]|nr:DUF1232 domain-containing protein [Chloroflexota bacterium]
MPQHSGAPLLLRWKQRLANLKTEVYALYLAYKAPHVSCYARLFTTAVVAYAFSPPDLIPDSIPIISKGASHDLFTCGITL